MESEITSDISQPIKDHNDPDFPILGALDCVCCHRSRDEINFFSAKERSKPEEGVVWRGEICAKWQGTLEAFHSAGLQGCRRCALVYDAVVSWDNDVASRAPDSTIRVEIEVEARTLPTNNPEEETISIRIWIPKNHGLGDTIRLFRMEPQETSSETPSEASIWGLMSSSALPEDPANDRTIRVLNRFISDCTLNHHSCCGSLKTGRLPKRVLYITSSSRPASSDNNLNIRLKENLTDHGRYSCLSHCWGPQGPSLKLLSGTAEKLRQGLSIGEIPKTFADAARVCYGLGIQYLWIDALCIQQDDKNDWKEAAATMADIYENAFLTIVAVCSQNSNTGFRPFPKDRFPVKKLPRWDVYARSEELEFTDYAFGPMTRPSWKETWPLLSRGWVYQERKLSARIAYFSETRVVWDCRTLQRAEEGETYRELEQNGASGTEGSVPGLRKFGFEGKDPVQAWMNAVEEYCQLSLTYECDRLPGIAALAERMMRIRGSDVYVAGMWKSSLLCDITWYLTFANAPRPLTTLPTWSWASTYGPTCTPVDRYNRRYNSTVARSDAELLNLSFTSLGPAIIGDVTDASIIIKAPVLEFTSKVEFDNGISYDFDELFEVTEVSPLFPYLNVPWNILNTKLYWIAVSWHEDFDLSSGEKPLAVGERVIALIVNDRGSQSAGILLQEATGGLYRRIGMILLEIGVKSDDSPSEQSEEWNEYDELYERELLDQFIESFPIKEVRII